MSPLSEKQPEDFSPEGFVEDQEARCGSCQQLYPNSALDRYLWCGDCREKVERETRAGRHLIALFFTVPFGVWVVLEWTAEVLSPWAWILPLAVAYYLGYRIGREVMKGWVRWRQAKSRGALE